MASTKLNNSSQITLGFHNPPVFSDDTAASNILKSVKNESSARAIKRSEQKPKLNNEIRICPICNAKFKLQSKYDYHMQTHLKCPVCARDIVGQYNLNQHMFVHSNEKPIDCPKCGRGFKNQYHMKKHLERTHATFDNVTCPICGKLFRREWALQLHMKGQHPETNASTATREYECYICHKPYKSEPTLRSHLYTHFRFKNLLCQLCGKSFYCKSKLQKHLMRDDHRAEDGIIPIVKPFKCEYCEKAFDCMSRLTMHRNVHTGEKPFACSSCGKRFTHLSNLNQHKLTHMDEKRHHCQICDHKCRSAGNLRKHMKVHTGR